jgi:hypothetical protein
MSPDASAVDYMKTSKLTRITFNINVTYTPQACQSFKCQEYQFKQQNIRDTHYDYDVLKNIQGYQEFVLMHNLEGGSLPWYANKTYYWLFSILTLGWVYRIIFVNNSKKITFSYNKLICR